MLNKPWSRAFAQADQETVFCCWWRQSQQNRINEFIRNRAKTWPWEKQWDVLWHTSTPSFLLFFLFPSTFLLPLPSILYQSPTHRPTQAKPCKWNPFFPPLKASFPFTSRPDALFIVKVAPQTLTCKKFSAAVFSLSLAARWAERRGDLASWWKCPVSMAVGC